MTRSDLGSYAASGVLLGFWGAAILMWRRPKATPTRPLGKLIQMPSRA